MIDEKKVLNLKFYSWEEIKEIFFKKNFNNVILFSQARSGSTFVSNVLAKELNFSENFFSEEFFLNQHFLYLKHFIKKHDNFFIHTNEYWFRRTKLIKDNTLYLYLYRDSNEILKSYKKAKENNYYLGWEEFINKYRVFFKDLKNIEPAPLFGHKVWENQIGAFDNAFTLSYQSFETHKFYLNKEIRQEKIRSLKDIELVNDTNIPKRIKNEMKGVIPQYEKNKINFNIFEKIYFFIRRKLESKKRSKLNY